MKTIDVANVFSKRPYGRYREDGPYSGQDFRDKHIVPALTDIGSDKLIVDLSGSRRYGSSFLDESFGGLVRLGFGVDFLKTHLEIKHNELPSIVELCWLYILQADSKE